MPCPDKFLDLWRISQLEKLTETPTSHLFKGLYERKPCVLKVYTEHGKKCESDSAVYLKAIDGHGGVTLLEDHEDAILLEYIDGQTLKEHVKNGQDNAATQIIGQTLKAIHHAPNSALNLPSMHDRLECLFEYETKSAPNIIKSAAHLSRHIIKTPFTDTVLHGDMHHDNIMHSSTRGWLAIDPQPFIGDPAYDCANTLHNPHQMFDLTENKTRLLEQANTLGSTMGIDPQRIINYAFIHGCLSACWSFEDEGTDFDQSPSIRTSHILQEFITTGYNK